MIRETRPPEGAAGGVVLSQRYVNLNKAFPATKGFCRYCGKPLTGRRTAWCSEECWQEAAIRAGYNVRDGLWERDHGICARCGLDTEGMKEELYRLLGLLKGYQGDWYDIYIGERLPEPCGYTAFDTLLLHKGMDAFLWKGHLWEAHHKVPVHKGGGGAGLADIETLCVRCHNETFKKAKPIPEKPVKGKSEKTVLQEMMF